MAGVGEMRCVLHVQSFGKSGPTSIATITCRAGKGVRLALGSLGRSPTREALRGVRGQELSLQRKRAVALLGVSQALGDFNEGVVLKAQMPGNIGVYVLHQRAQSHGWCRFLVVDLGVDFLE